MKFLSHRLNSHQLLQMLVMLRTQKKTPLTGKERAARCRAKKAAMKLLNVIGATPPSTHSTPARPPPFTPVKEPSTPSDAGECSSNPVVDTQSKAMTGAERQSRWRKNQAAKKLTKIGVTPPSTPFTSVRPPPFTPAKESSTPADVVKLRAIRLRTHNYLPLAEYQ